MSNKKYQEFLDKMEVTRIVYVGNKEDEDLVLKPSISSFHCAPKFVLLGSGTLILFPYSINHSDAQRYGICNHRDLIKKDRRTFYGDPVAAGTFFVGPDREPHVTKWSSTTLRLKTPESLKEKISHSLENYYREIQ